MLVAKVKGTHNREMESATVIIAQQSTVMPVFDSFAQDGVVYVVYVQDTDRFIARNFAQFKSNSDAGQSASAIRKSLLETHQIELGHAPLKQWLAKHYEKSKQIVCVFIRGQASASLPLYTEDH